MKEFKESSNQQLSEDEKKLQALADIASRQSQTRRNRGARNIIAGAVAFFILAGLVLGLMLTLSQNKISVSFYQGSELIQTIKVSKDSRISKEIIPIAPEKDGKVFTGNWFTNPNATGDPFDFETKITTTKKLYAEMESKKITVEIQKNDSSGGSITLLQDINGYIIFPTYEDFITTVNDEYSQFYELLGFDSDANSTSPNFHPGDVVSESPETLYAIWTPKFYKAYIIGDDAKHVYSDSDYLGRYIPLSYGDKYYVDYEDFDFLYQVGTGARVNGLKITIDEIEYFFELGSTIIIDQRFTNDTIEFDLSYMAEKNILTIDYDNPEYDNEVYFGYRGSTNMVLLPEQPNTDTHRLDDYVSSEDGSILSPGTQVPVNGEITYKAKWGGLSSFIFFNYNGGELEPPIGFHQKYGEGYFNDGDHTEPLDKVRIPKKEGYVFTGYWFRADDGSEYYVINEKGEFEDVLLGYDFFKHHDEIHAEYDESTIEEGIKISFVSNGGTLINALSTTYGEKLSGLTKPEPTRNHYEFAGWYEDAELLKLVNWEKYTITESVTFYAKWNATTYYIRFDPASLESVKYPNSDKLTGLDSIPIIYGDYYSVRLDKEPFSGLYEKNTGKRVVGVRALETNRIYNSANPYIRVDRDVTLVFVFEITCNIITINYNGGSENGTTNLYETTTFYGMDSNISLHTTVKKQFYILLGYSTKSLSYDNPNLTTITASELQDSKVKGGETTYYAIWEPISVNFIYNVNGGTGTASGSTSTKFGNANFTLAGRGTMTQDFKTFAGWSLQPNGAVAHAANSVLNINAELLISNEYEISNYKIGENQITIKLYAKWIQNNK